MTSRTEMLEKALEYFVSFGCPVCKGDCASANPPMGWSCPMLQAREALAAFRSAEEAPATGESLEAEEKEMRRLAERLGFEIANPTAPAKDKVEEIARLIKRIKFDNEGVDDEPKPSGSYIEGWDAAFRIILEDERLSAISPSASARDEALEEALQKIAEDYKVYRGHNDYDEGPMSGAEAQAIARRALKRTTPAPRSGEWLPIETAPICEDVLVGGWLSERCWFQIVAKKVPARANAWVSDAGTMTFVPTMWQPLPLPPESKPHA